MAENAEDEAIAEEELAESLEDEAEADDSEADDSDDRVSVKMIFHIEVKIWLRGIRVPLPLELQTLRVSQTLLAPQTLPELEAFRVRGCSASTR